MHTKALFPGSFDPFTKGHDDIVRRALKVVDTLVIGIGMNTNKHTLFTPEERLRMIQDLYKDNPRIEVKTYGNLTVDFAREIGADCMIRSLRSVKDYEYELSIADINRRLSGIETVILFTDPSLSYFSSSVVRELLSFGKDITEFLPEGMRLIKK